MKVLLNAQKILRHPIEFLNILVKLAKVVAFGSTFEEVKWKWKSYGTKSGEYGGCGIMSQSGSWTAILVTLWDKEAQQVVFLIFFKCQPFLNQMLHDDCFSQLIMSANLKKDFLCCNKLKCLNHRFFWACRIIQHKREQTLCNGFPGGRGGRWLTPDSLNTRKIQDLFIMVSLVH